MIRERRGVAGHARRSSAGCGRRGPIRAVRARPFRRQPRADEAAWAAADGWDSATVAPRPPVTVPRLLLRARVGDSAAVGPIHQRAGLHARPHHVQGSPDGRLDQLFLNSSIHQVTEENKQLSSYCYKYSDPAACQMYMTKRKRFDWSQVCLCAPLNPPLTRGSPKRRRGRRNRSRRRRRRSCFLRQGRRGGPSGARAPASP